MQDLAVQREIRHQALQPVVFLAQLPQLAQLLHARSRVPPLPHPELPANVSRFFATFVLLQHRNDLLFAVSFFGIVEPHRWLLEDLNRLRYSSFDWFKFRILGRLYAIYLFAKVFICVVLGTK